LSSKFHCEAKIFRDISLISFRFTNRGLYEQHKFLFTLLLALKVDLNNGQIQYNEFLIFLKGGASLDLNSVKVCFCTFAIFI
jgi:dynein heavy chain